MQENTGSAEVRDAPLAAPKPRPHWGRRWTGHGIRFTFWSILAACLLFAGLVAATRFWIVPNADSSGLVSCKSFRALPVNVSSLAGLLPDGMAGRRNSR